MPTVHIVDSVGIGPLNGRVVSNSSKNQRKIQGIKKKIVVVIFFTSMFKLRKCYDSCFTQETCDQRQKGEICRLHGVIWKRRLWRPWYDRHARSPIDDDNSSYYDYYGDEPLG